MARLPIPGDDKGTWGNILNDFLSQEHNDDGSLKKSDDIASTKNLTETGRLSESQLNDTYVLKNNVALNVKDFGALGNGTANDTAAINAAIAALTWRNIIFSSRALSYARRTCYQQAM